MTKTAADKWKEKIVKYRKQCQKVLEVSSSIRYAGIINAYGRTLTGITRPNVKPLLKSEDVKNEFFIVSTLMSLRKASTSTVGKLEHVILQHQKVTIVILQKVDVTYYVSIDKKENNVSEIISLIKKII